MSYPQDPVHNEMHVVVDNALDALLLIASAEKFNLHTQQTTNTYEHTHTQWAQVSSSAKQHPYQQHVHNISVETHICMYSPPPPPPPCTQESAQVSSSAKQHYNIYTSSMCIYIHQSKHTHICTRTHIHRMGVG